MHSTEDFRSSSFAISLGGSPAALEDVLPGFTALDRLGVVVRTPGGATGASLLLLAAVTAFYDRQRALAEEFFAYPDNFAFHLGSPRGEHGMLDLWPPHKEVVVSGGGEELLRAINDRGVTRLLVEDGPPSAGAFEPETLASARARVVTALAYDPRGRAAGADVEIAGDEVSEAYVAKVLASEGVGAAVAATLTAARAALRLEADDRPVEAYRRIELEEALGLLSG